MTRSSQAAQQSILGSRVPCTLCQGPSPQTSLEVGDVPPALAGPGVFTSRNSLGWKTDILVLPRAPGTLLPPRRPLLGLTLSDRTAATGEATLGREKWLSAQRCPKLEVPIHPRAALLRVRGAGGAVRFEAMTRLGALLVSSLAGIPGQGPGPWGRDAHVYGWYRSLKYQMPLPLISQPRLK